VLRRWVRSWQRSLRCGLLFGLRCCPSPHGEGIGMRRKNQPKSWHILLLIVVACTFDIFNLYQADFGTDASVSIHDTMPVDIQLHPWEKEHILCIIGMNQLPVLGSSPGSTPALAPVCLPNNLVLTFV
jgi:hypothetical protein